MDDSHTPTNLPSPPQNMERRCSSMTTAYQTTPCTSTQSMTIPSEICDMKEWLYPSFIHQESSSTSKGRDGSWSAIEPMDTWQQPTMWRTSGNSEEETLYSGSLMELIPTSEWT